MFDITRKHKLLLLAVALMAGGICGLLIATGLDLPGRSTAKTEPGVKTVKGEIDIQNAFIKVADAVGPAVVSVYTETTHKIEMRRFHFGGESPFQDKFFQDFFKDFFRDIPEREYKQRGLGSGVIIDKEGYILTNEHVIRGAEKITVALSDGREFEGIVKGADPRSDLAVVKIEANNLPVAELGDSDLVQIGEWAMAIGNPFGYIMRSPKPTVTVGVISALHRSLPRRLPGYTDLIQTDAAINPGNSGGPLCDLNSKVIGINVAIFTQYGGYQGVGFAIPINYAKEILGDLIKGKKVLYGWLGISVQDLTKELADYFGVADNEGILVAGVVEGGPAGKGGMKEGDIIKTFDEKKIKNVDELLRIVSRARVEKTVKVGIIRNKKAIDLSITVEERPAKIDKGAIPGAAAGPERKEDTWRGMTISGITGEIAAQLNLTDKMGVVITNIKFNSPAHESGLRRGDVIREIDRKRINNPTDFENVLTSLKGDVLIRTERGYIIVKEK